ncbi:MAG: DUF429 domain-containing protein [Pseudomonadota bacterium]
MTAGAMVAGVDGCPAGWLVVTMDAGEPEAAGMQFCAQFSDVLALNAKIIAVDMPIGLPERYEGRGRTCEVEARKRLGARQSSVFAIPARAAVMETDYRASCAASLATSDPPRKVSKQAFNLFPKIREIDGHWVSGMEARVFECHPELAFWALMDGAPMALPKKIKSRPNPDGMTERRDALVGAGFSIKFLTPTERLPGRAGLDDLLDATVCAWSAARILAGEAVSFPDLPERDVLGRPMAITV